MWQQIGFRLWQLVESTFHLNHFDNFDTTGTFPSPFKPSGIWKGVQYMETSAKLNINIDESFKTLAKILIQSRRIRHQRRKQYASRRKRNDDKCILM